jgi:hypothetical protein
MRTPGAISPAATVGGAVSKTTGRFVFVFGVASILTVTALGYAYGNWLVGVLGTCMLPSFVLFLWWGWTHPRP